MEEIKDLCRSGHGRVNIIKTTCHHLAIQLEVVDHSHQYISHIIIVHYVQFQ